MAAAGPPPAEDFDSEAPRSFRALGVPLKGAIRVPSKGIYEDLGVFGFWVQRVQNPLAKEYSLTPIRVPIMI